MRRKLYTIAIIRFFLSLVGYIFYAIAYPFHIIGIIGEMYLSSHSAFVTSTKHLLAELSQPVKKAE